MLFHLLSESQLQTIPKGLAWLRIWNVQDLTLYTSAPKSREASEVTQLMSSRTPLTQGPESSALSTDPDGRFPLGTQFPDHQGYGLKCTGRCTLVRKQNVQSEGL